jgi:hypothetical protein
MSMNDSIFVRIASYRDTECGPTIVDLFEKAANPSRLRVGVCLQYAPKRDSPNLRLGKWAPQVELIRVRSAESRGVCWARAQTETLYRGECYSLQVDSHSRFAPGFDDYLVDALARANTEKAVLSCSPAPYVPGQPLDPEPRLTRRVPVAFEHGRLRLAQRGKTNKLKFDRGRTAREKVPDKDKFGNPMSLTQTGTVHILGIGGSGKFDPDVANLIKKDPEGAAAALQAFAAGRKPTLTGKLKGQGNKLASAALLINGLESARNQSSLFSGAAVTSLIANGVEPEAALKMLPMAPTGAVQANESVEKFREGKKNLSSFQERADPNDLDEKGEPKKKPGLPRQMVENEVKLVVKFVEDVLGKKLVFDDKTSLLAQLQKMRPDIERKLRDFFELHLEQEL